MVLDFWDIYSMSPINHIKANSDHYKQVGSQLALNKKFHKQ